MRSVKNQFCCLFLVCLALSLNAGYPSLLPNSQCNQSARMVTEIGRRVREEKSFSPDARSLRVDSLGAKYLRVRIRAQSSNGCQWYLTIRDGQRHVVQTFTAEDFQRSPTRWTNRIPKDIAFLDLAGCENSPLPQIKYDQYLAMPDHAIGTYYSSQGPIPKFIELYGPSDNQTKQLGDYVGFLMSGHETNTWSCSGVLVASDLFLTNWHCGKPDDPAFPADQTWSDQIVKDTIIDLSWDDDALSREYNAAEVVSQDKNLDFALLRIEPINPMGQARPAPIRPEPLAANQPIRVVHHPAGSRKQVSANCSIASPSYSGVDFTHRCDTESGSSGAPIFNISGEVVGLHYKGFDYDTNCKPDRLNKAIRIDKIIAFLRQTQPSIIPRLQVRN